MTKILQQQNKQSEKYLNQSKKANFKFQYNFKK